MKHTPLPAEPVSLALYLVHLMDIYLSSSSVSIAAYSVAWVHRKLGLVDILECPIIQQTFASARRLLAHPSKKRKPLSSSHMRQLISKFGSTSSPLPFLQIVVLATLGFSGFLRWNGLSHLCLKHVDFHKSYLVLRLKKRKNDQIRKGSKIAVARTNTSTCPVCLLERFVQRGKHKQSQRLFCRVRYVKGRYMLSESPLSYSRTLELFRDLLRKIHLDAKTFGLHSPRSGGATEAARSGVRGRVWRRHGGWRSVKAADGYVGESLHNSLIVTRNLGL